MHPIAQQTVMYIVLYGYVSIIDQILLMLKIIGIVKIIFISSFEIILGEKEFEKSCEKRPLGA